MEETKLMAVIADEDTVTGFLLTGMGDVDKRKNRKNFFVVDSKTPQSAIEDAFRAMTARDDIAIVMITQVVANEIRHVVAAYDKMMPTVVEIPSKDHPYNPSQDPVMQRVQRFFGEV